MIELVDKAFDQVALAIETEIARQAFGSIGARGDYGTGALKRYGHAEVVGVIGPIGDDMVGAEPGDQRFAEQDIAPLPRRGDDASGQAEGIGGEVDLGRQTPARAAKAVGRSAPLFRGAPAA